MKKLLMIACMMFIGMAAFAQQGATWVGVNANYGMHKDYKNFGVGAKVQYEFIDNFRAEASGNYFLKKDNCTMWDVNLNLHYLIPVGGVKIYPLAGLTLLGSKVDIPEITMFGVTTGGGSASDSDFGANVGAGVEFPLSDAIKLNIEGKYQIVKDWDRPVISAGVAFAL